MKLNMENLNEEDLKQLKWILLNVCRDYEPWADMMMLGGAGDLGAYDFPLDLGQIESIDITVVGREGHQEPIAGSPEAE